MSERITIGKIIAAHGVHGEVKVQPLTDFPRRFKKTKKVWVDAVNHYLDIEQVREQQDLFLIKFCGFDHREEAEKLKNSLVQVDPDQVAKLPPGHFFHFQIIGLDVYDADSQHLGQVKEILETGANDVYVVKRENKKDLLLPALKSVVLAIDVDHQKMVVELPRGLDD
ncbi:ribosome maturation factor RimM [Candidatus Formimonas warabiya]|uniref:ribosome maturation factor RimM n=1 Tax=Formimonas warabiya TaxID=1761012 RepID=UPI0011D05E9D|nr:ribosome maturation factor RimM [Candidatus Formimonas warabiya]